jgi:dienelactone hydrolase
MEHPAHDPAIRDYLRELYDTRSGGALEAADADSLRAWQDETRPLLHRLLGLDAIARFAAGHEPRVELGAPEARVGYTRRRGTIESEPGFCVPFWYLRPDGEGPFPLAVTPHGHDRYGPDTSIGLAHDDEHRRKIDAEDRDVAVQAVRRGFAAIAPAARGTSTTGIPDINGRHGNRDCRSQFMHALLAGRTATGERVWDVMRLVDWAESIPEIDTTTVLVMGNSGGGIVTLYAAAADERVTVAVPSCSYCTLVGETGLVHHCDCNAVPGIGAIGEIWDVAALVAPRHLCIVNGRTDDLFPVAEVDRAAGAIESIYERAGAPERVRHAYGEAGHRFYADLMWPFVEAAREAGRGR